MFEGSRSVVSAEGASSIARLLDGEVDWRYLIDVSLQHATTPLLRRGLLGAAERADLSRIPEEVWRELDSISARAGARSDRLYRGIADVAVELERIGVPALALKDLSLAVDTYPERALRPIGDLDLLVARTDFVRAAACLRELGFAPVSSRAAPYGDRYLGGRHFRREDGSWIDLQWTIGEREWDRHGDGRFTYDVDGMWRRSRAAGIEGCRLQAPSHEDMFFHLCVHAEGHEYRELILLCDIAEILRVRGQSLDWDLIASVARQHQAVECVAFTLSLAASLLGASAPDGATRGLRARYYPGTLNGPIFGTLGPLHESLDEMYNVGASERVLRAAEVVVRRQAVHAMRLHAEITGLLQDFFERGGHAVALDGQSSCRIVPDSRVPAFRRIEVSILSRDEAAFRRSLADTSFVVSDGGGRRWTARHSWRARDPVLSATPMSLELRLELTHGLKIASKEAEPTRRARALAPFRARMPRRDRVRDEGVASVFVTVRCLSDAEFVVAACERFARRSASRLHALCELAAAVEPVLPLVEEDAIARLARERGVEQELEHSLGLLDRLAGRVRESHPPNQATDSSTALLEYARYGPAQLERYPQLRDLYFAMLTLLASADQDEARSYLRRSLFGEQGRQPILPLSLLGAARALVGGRARIASSPRDFVYWLDTIS